MGRYTLHAIQYRSNYTIDINLVSWPGNSSLMRTELLISRTRTAFAHINIIYATTIICQGNLARVSRISTVRCAALVWCGWAISHFLCWLTPLSEMRFVCDSLAATFDSQYSTRSPKYQGPTEKIFRGSWWPYYESNQYSVSVFEQFFSSDFRENRNQRRN